MKKLYRVIPIDDLPDSEPVFAVQQFASKEFAKFHLVEAVLVPADEKLTEDQITDRLKTMMDEDPVKLTSLLLSLLASRLVAAGADDATISQQQNIGDTRYKVTHVTSIDAIGPATH